MMRQPLISVVVPVYNVEQYLDECVKSLQKQSYENLEILLIDDGSPDRCPVMSDSYAKEDHRIKVIHKENGGLADARNVGLDQASGEFIAFVDSDDWIAPEMYEEMMNMFDEDSSLDVVCCAASRVLRGEEVASCFSYYETGTILSGKKVTQRILLDEIGSQVVKGVYRRACWENIRFPLGMLYEDIPTTYRAFMRARRVGFINKPFYKYRMNEEGISNSPRAVKPYHIYLGFKSHYLCAVEAFPEISERCCANAGHYAISTYFHYCSERSSELKQAVPDVRQFMDEHKKIILQDIHMPRSRMIALKVYYFSEPIFRNFCRIFHKLGIQKWLGFDMK